MRREKIDKYHEYMKVAMINNPVAMQIYHDRSFAEQPRTRAPDTPTNSRPAVRITAAQQVQEQAARAKAAAAQAWTHVGPGGSERTVGDPAAEVEETMSVSGNSVGARSSETVHGSHEEMVEVTKVAPHCPKCGIMMVPRRQIITKELFWGCSQYPRCNGTFPLQVRRGQESEWQVPTHLPTSGGTASGSTPEGGGRASSARQPSP